VLLARVARCGVAGGFAAGCPWRVAPRSFRRLRRPHGCPFESRPTAGRRSCSLTPFAAQAATSVLPLVSLAGPQPHGTSRLPSLVAGGCRRQRLPRAALLAPLSGHSEARATAAFIYKRLSPSLMAI